MPEILLLTESELRACVRLDRCAIDLIADGFAALETDAVVMPPVLGMELPAVNGEVDVKTAYLPQLDTFTIKISPGFFDNPAKGLPSLNGLMVTFAADTGLLRAILLDNGYLTDLRTAAAGGVAARHLAPRDTRVAGVIGCGVQAELQLRALQLERDLERAYVWARNPESAGRFAERQSHALDLEVCVAPGIETLVAESQVVLTTTPAKSPLVRAEWLHPGLHITAMGADSPEKNELDPHILTAADRVVTDRVSQSMERGELRAALAQGVIDSTFRPDEIGAICSGAVSGRESDAEITVCDLTGTGVQDTVIAEHAIRIALQNQAGKTLST